MEASLASRLRCLCVPCSFLLWTSAVVLHDCSLPLLFSWPAQMLPLLRGLSSRPPAGCSLLPQFNLERSGLFGSFLIDCGLTTLQDEGREGMDFLHLVTLLPQWLA